MFRGFFLRREFNNQEFFFDVAFYLLPRKAEAGEKILEQGDDVNEIYFILDGEVRLSFKTPEGEVCRYFGKEYYFGDYYVFFEKPAEFDYISTTPVNMLVLPKSKMQELSTKYKQIHQKMLSNSIKNSMYTSKSMQSSYKILLESENAAGPVHHQEVVERYQKYVKGEAKKKKEERVRRKNIEIFKDENAAPVETAKTEDESNKNYLQNLESLEMIAKKIDRLKRKLEDSLT